MDQPLFGEQKKEARVLIWLIGAVLVVFTGFSLIVGVIYSLPAPNHRHFALVAVVIFASANLILMWIWWNDKEDRPHPRFKWLIILNILALLLANSTLNVYIWRQEPKLPSCPGGFLTDSGACYLYSQLPSCLTSPYVYCMRFVGNPPLGTCVNATAYYGPQTTLNKEMLWGL